MSHLYRGSRIQQMLVEKERTDAMLSTVDRSNWYLPKDELLSEKARGLFSFSYFDQSAQDFLDNSFKVSNSICLQTWYALASTFLALFVSKTSSNGILHRGGMFIFSNEQLKEFLKLPVEWDSRGKKLLDLGAGDGGVTSQAASLFEHVYATEMSTIMQWRLKERGFTVLEVDEWTKNSREYDLITVLNLLDRHYNPKILLQQLHEVSLRNNCPVLLGLVLPIRQYVEFHPNGSTTRPDSWIDVEGQSFEEQVGSLIEKTFEPSGFEVIRWTKMPYLCEGDFQKPYYLLNDALFLLKAVDSGKNPQNNVDSSTRTHHSHIDL